MQLLSNFVGLHNLLVFSLAQVAANQKGITLIKSLIKEFGL